MIDYRIKEQVPDEVISVGDRFPAGKFEEIYSRHTDAINFCYDNRVVSVVTGRISPGASRILLRTFDSSGIRTVTHTPGEIIINEEILFKYGSEEIFDSGLSFRGETARFHPRTIDILKSSLLSDKSCSSLTFLLTDEEGVTSSPGSYDEVLKKRMRAALEMLKTGRIGRAVMGFRGCGYGLTPSGDDFLSGILLGLNFREYLGEGDLTLLKREIYALARGSDPLVNTFLFEALQGYYNDNWKCFLSELFRGGDRVAAFCERILDEGATSGRDCMTGFLTAFEIDIEGCRYGYSKCNS